MNKEITISFTGDIMCDNNIILNKMDYSNFFDENIVKILKNSDYTVGNLETPIVNETIENKIKYSFSAPKSFAKYIRESGIDFVSTANNHCLDQGIRGIIESINNLEDIGLEHTGTYIDKEQSEKIFIKKIGGMNIAFLSYTYGTNAFINNYYLDYKNDFYIDLLKKQEFSNKFLRKLKDKFFENVYFYNYNRDKYFLKRLEKKIKKAKQSSDMVILCLHSGGQYNKKVDGYTKKLCKYISDLGVDIIIGNHPHVVQSIKKYKNTLIFYSLGNFFATPFANHNQKDDYPDYSIILNINIDTTQKKIKDISYSISKTVMNENIKNYNIYDLYQQSSATEKSEIIKNVNKINRALNNNENLIKSKYKLNIV